MTFVRRVWQSSSDGCGPRLFPLVAVLEEVDADLVAGQFAAPVGQSGGRQQQKEFLEVQAFDRAFDGQLGSRLRDVFHMQSRRQVPSIAIISAGIPRSNTTRLPLR